MTHAPAESSALDYAANAPAGRPISRAAFWGGWVLSAVPSLFTGVGGIAMMFNTAMIRDGLTQQGFVDPPRAVWTVLVLEVLSVALYLFPRTAVLGAILLTGYLGGAIAIHLRVAEYPQMIVPFVLGVMVWLGLFLRDRRVRALLPLRSPAHAG
ncbi:MAG TPA: DoxX family protein [Tepidisphaeraceae bacterium]|jgi:hypothetical protein